MEKKLLLRIDWSGELKFGAQLSPTFTLMGIQLESPPTVRIHLDERLNRDDWKVSPDVHEMEPHTWVFHERLSIKPRENAVGDAAYALTLEAEFRERDAGVIRPFLFRTTVLLHVSADRRREVVIEASDGALINTHRMDWSEFDKVRISAQGDALVNLTEGIIPDGLQRTDETENTATNLFQVPLVAMPNFPVAAPRRKLLLRAIMPNGRVRLYHLFARHRILLGRGRECDVVYRFNRKSTGGNSPSDYLSLFISRKHAIIMFAPEGMSFQDLSTLGLEIRPHQGFLPSENIISLSRGDLNVLDWEEVKRGKLEMRISQFASLFLEAFSAHIDDLEVRLINQHIMYEENRETLWSLGNNQGVDVLRLRRKANFDCSGRKNILESCSDEHKIEFAKMETQWGRHPDWKKDPFAEEEEYFFLLRGVTLGSNLQNDVMYLNERGIRTNHVTFYFCGDHFGMTNHDRRALNYEKADGSSEQLYQDDLLGLEPGMKFQIGSVKFDVWEDYPTFLNPQHGEIKK
ncbi:MAG: FHA domain-containing protein [Planctomycetia bacterium]|nr:FHA domain-containing protein [Planctomycetia bacterium]